MPSPRPSRPDPHRRARPGVGLDLGLLRREDLVALAALKLWTEVGVPPDAGAGLFGRVADAEMVAFLESGPRTIGGAPIDAVTLRHARTLSGPRSPEPREAPGGAEDGPWEGDTEHDSVPRALRADLSDALTSFARVEADGEEVRITGVPPDRSAPDAPYEALSTGAIEAVEPLPGFVDEPSDGEVTATLLTRPALHLEGLLDP